ncbi:hypothetical protein [Acidianus brierleyi]|uniref:Uncharacterized protein n=1 Tax=Acidianus brierleyi TaxID=41673 RepID=A0A2U9IB68_9CREN|nr:hypothetical protein [Acidianus brierleyi]AWR93250.1 hypothetical protein DFR85_00110 [Acidianus brierleyi]
MRLIYYIAKRLLTNPYDLIWAVGFMIFWILMGAYIFSPGIAHGEYYNQEVYYYTSGWAGTIILFSLGSLSVGITAMLNYQTGGLSHLFRYSKLTPLYYISSIYIGSIIASLIIGSTMIAFTTVAFSNRFGFIVYPKDILLLIISIILTAIFLTSFSMFLSIITLKTTRKIREFINMVPLLFSFLFGFGYLYLKLNYFTYASPFTMVDSLTMSGYLGKPSPLNYASIILSGQSGSFISIPLAIISSILWTVVLTIIDIIGIRKLYYKPLEEEKLA